MWKEQNLLGSKACGGEGLAPSHSQDYGPLSAEGPGAQVRRAQAEQGRRKVMMSSSLGKPFLACLLSEWGRWLRTGATPYCSLGPFQPRVTSLCWVPTVCQSQGLGLLVPDVVGPQTTLSGSGRSPSAQGQKQRLREMTCPEAQS